MKKVRALQLIPNHLKTEDKEKQLIYLKNEYRRLKEQNEKLRDELKRERSLKMAFYKAFINKTHIEILYKIKEEMK